MRKLALNDEILLKVDKAARYIGGEVNSVMKDKEKVDVRFAMCFPDVYEIGMSHLGIQILYDMFNKREDTWCERVYSPWTDLDAVMREKNLPLFTLESQDPVKEFDFLGITISMRCDIPIFCRYWICPAYLCRLQNVPGRIPSSSAADPVPTTRSRLLSFLICFI